MEYKYFDREQCKFLPIHGKVYPANFASLWTAIPALMDENLILHKTLNPGKPKWTCSHAGTGFAIAYGKTRQEAMKKAESIILHQGNERFLKAINYAQALKETREAVNA